MVRCGRGLYLALLLAMSAPVSLAAQSSLSGVVRDAESGGALTNAIVQLAGSGLRTVTDAQGHYVIRGVSAGTWTLTARRIGYRPSSQSFTMGEATSITLDFDLAPIAVSLAEMVVSPSRFSALEEQPVTTATLSREEIATQPQLGEDLYRAINRLPGLSSSDISARFWVRGGPNTELLARLDGLDLIEPFHLKDFDGALSIIDVATIGSLDLTTGGFTTEYGDRLTAVMSMSTLSADSGRSHTTLGLSITSFRAMNRGTFGGGRGKWLVSARRGYLDIVLRLTGDADSLSPAYYDAFAKLEYQLSDRHQVALHVLHARDDLTYSDRTVLKSAYSSSYAWGSWEGLFGSRLTGSAVLWVGHLGWRRSGNGPLGGADTIGLRDERTFNVVGLRQDWTASLSRRALIKGGLDVQSLVSHYDYSSIHTGNFLRNDSLLRFVDTTVVAMHPEGWALGAYAALRVQPFANLTVELGARWDRHTYAPGGQVRPRLNAAYALSPNTTLRAAWGGYAQAQGIHEMQVQDGESTFSRPELAEQRVLGIEHRLPNAVAIRVEAYQRRYSHLRPTYVNLGGGSDAFPELEGDRYRVVAPTGEARGIEVLVERRLGGRFDWSASYALARAWDDSLGGEIPRAQDQRHTLVVDMTWAPGRNWRISWGWQFHSGWPYSPASFVLDTTAAGQVVVIGSFGRVNSARVPDYQRIDMRISKEWHTRRGGWRVYLDMFNLLDAANPRGFDYNLFFRNGALVTRSIPDTQLGFLPSLGVTWDF